MTYSREELAHFGVKGMKWGVRREAKRNYKAYTKSAQANLASVKWQISEADYKKMSAKPITLGRDFSRLVEKNKTDLRDFVYVTTNKDDRDRYRAFFGPGGKRSTVKRKDELTIKTSKVVRSPGEKERLDAYIKVLGDGLKRDRELQNAFGGPEAAKALNAREVGFRSFQNFNQSGHMGTSLHSSYFKEIRARGYNAVIDDADAGIFSRTPTIIFPEESGARVVAIKPITKEDILQAKIDIKPVL